MAEPFNKYVVMPGSPKSSDARAHITVYCDSPEQVEDTLLAIGGVTSFIVLGKGEAGVWVDTMRHRYYNDVFANVEWTVRDYFVSDKVPQRGTSSVGY